MKPGARKRVVSGIALVGAVSGIACLWWWPHEVSKPETGLATDEEGVFEAEFSLATLSHVLETGGCELTREAAIGWLDQQTREQIEPSSDTQTVIFSMLRDAEGHAAWPLGYREHLFNSACNALRVRASEGTAEALANILHDHVRSRSDRTLRLYSLQHIDSLRKAGKLGEPLAGAIHQTLEELAENGDSDIAGTALQLLAVWDGDADGAAREVLELAARTAADRQRPVDIRVSAIHTAGAAGLVAARAIATDPAEPMLLRKAAIACLGRDGNASDVPTLETLKDGHFRLAQAAEPALVRLRTRIKGESSPPLLPYP